MKTLLTAKETKAVEYMRYAPIDDYADGASIVRMRECDHTTVLAIIDRLTTPKPAPPPIMKGKRAKA